MIVKSAARLCDSPSTTLTLVDEARENLVRRAAWIESDADQHSGASLPLDIGASLPLTDSGVAALAVEQAH